MSTDLGALLQRFRAERGTGISLCKGASMVDIQGAIEPYCDFIPDEIRELYTACNGLRIGEFEVLPLEEALWPDLDCMNVHLWGNGDSDAVRLAADSDRCSVWFCGHDPPWHFVVADSIAEWLGAVYDEWKRYGEVMDPWGCHKTGASRLYTPRGDFNYPAD